MQGTESTPARSPSAIRRYARLWGRVPRELGFILPVLPLSVAGLTVVVTLLATGLGLLVVLVGALLVVAALWAARAFASFEILRLRGSGLPRLRHPEWDGRRRGLWRVVGALRGRWYWLALLHTLVIGVVGALTWSLVIAWVAVSATGLGSSVLVSLPDQRTLSLGVGVGPLRIGDDTTPGAIVLLTGVGLVFLATFPFVTRAMTWVHWLLCRALLGSLSRAALSDTIRSLDAARSSATEAESQALRRLERDIHDGPQQRLIRLQMDIAAALRRIDDDPEKAKRTLIEAQGTATDALEELRALSRGLGPPILLDRGLLAAIEAIAEHSSLPMEVTETLGGRTLPDAVERTAYFVVSEAVSNAAKHSHGTTIAVRFGLDPDDQHGTVLLVTVTDNGCGGARYVESHGLDGLRKRVEGARGVFEVMSPDGGPTVLRARLPLSAVAEGEGGTA